MGKEIFYMKTIIVGGVACGASCAARLRRLDENREIIIIEKGGYVSYANCGLPYFVADEIKRDDDILLNTKESFKDKYNIEVRLNEEVVSVNPEKKEITIFKDGDTYIENYDDLVLSPGLKPIMLKLPNFDSPYLVKLKNVSDALSLKKRIAKEKIKSIVMIGGGYIGMELSEALTNAGIAVTVIELADHIIGPLDNDFALIAQKECLKRGLMIKTSESVQGIELNPLRVITDKGEYPCDLVVSNVGNVPDTAFLESSGIERNKRGYIKVNENGETSIKDIYAGGDATCYKDYIFGEETQIALASIANKQGRMIADKIMNLPSQEKIGMYACSILKLFSLNIAMLGYNKKQLLTKNISFHEELITGYNHASYYPDAEEMFIKVYYDDEYQLLGAQIIGGGYVDKKIDVLTTLMYYKKTLLTLTDIPFAYAPMFNSAKDLLNMLGYVLENKKNNLLKDIDYSEINFNEDNLLLDVRTEREYQHGHLKNFINIPLQELRERLDEVKALAKGKKIYLHCKTDVRSYLALRILSQKGLDCYNVRGRYDYLSLVHQEDVIK